MTKPGLEILMASRALEVITTEFSSAIDGCETGGILLGTADTRHIDVRHAGRPGPLAIRAPTFFLRDRLHSQQLADACFTIDGSVWIGEWHSHVGAPPVPSNRDLHTYGALLDDAELAFTLFVSIIVVGPPTRPVLAGWISSQQAAYPARIVGTSEDRATATTQKDGH